MRNRKRQKKKKKIHTHWRQNHFLCCGAPPGFVAAVWLQTSWPETDRGHRIKLTSGGVFGIMPVLCPDNLCLRMDSFHRMSNETSQDICRYTAGWHITSITGFCWFHWAADFLHGLIWSECFIHFLHTEPSDRSCHTCPTRDWTNS